MLIKEITKDERPRERLIKYGVESLSNEELLSILFRCGTKNKSCKELSLELIKYVNGIDNLKEISLNKLLKIDGIGPSKASIILSCIELGRRVFLKTNNEIKEKYNSSQKIYNSFKNLFKDIKQEYFYCIYFDNKQHAIGKKLLFIGTINRSVVHPREIFKYAYIYSANTIACLHNHPSGEITPSKEDVELTNAIVEIGKLNKIPIIDHIIIGEHSYYSFQDNGKINNI